MEEWKEYKLGDVCSISSSKRIFANEYQLSGIPFYRGKEIIEKQKGEPITNELYISEERFNEIRDKFGTPQKGDMLLTSVGTLGIPYIVKDEKFYFKDGNLTWFYNFRGINNVFLYYWFLSPAAQYLINAQAIGSTQKALTIETLKKFDILLPPIDIQNKIVYILKSLDDKIEVNRKINENLEQQAQALFKSWFVDFEPFKNGEFVESELGMIPKGWRVGRYDDIIESTISGDWGKEKPEGNYTHKVACIRGCDFQDIKNGLRGKTPERFILEKNFQTKHFKDKDVLVEISGGTATVSTGRVCPVSQLLIDKFNDDIVCTNFCRLVRPRNNYGAYLYYSWLYKYNNKVMFGYENGTSGIKNFRIKDFISLEPVVIPSEEALLAFQSMIDKLQMKLQMNGSESQKLATLRDTLLPKLMSGELNVFDKPNDLS